MNPKDVEAVARAIDTSTDEALKTHGRFDTVQMARAAITADIIADLYNGLPPRVDAQPFCIDRF